MMMSILTTSTFDINDFHQWDVIMYIPFFEDVNFSFNNHINDDDINVDYLNFHCILHDDVNILVYNLIPLGQILFMVIVIAQSQL